jgi:hypothetical protein
MWVKDVVRRRSAYLSKTSPPHRSTLRSEAKVFGELVRVSADIVCQPQLFHSCFTVENAALGHGK